MIIIEFIFVVVVSYALGSIPFGYMLTKAAGLGDVREIGSGNIGATNVMRTGHKWLGIITLLLDAGKGYLAVWIAQSVNDGGFTSIAALFAVLGHVFPVWLRFKGGKGVATTIGVIFAMNWVLALCICVMWLSVFCFMRVSSVAALVSIGYSWGVAYLLDDYQTALLAFFLGLLILYTHRQNISRLVHGTEYAFRKDA